MTARRRACRSSPFVIVAVLAATACAGGGEATDATAAVADTPGTDDPAQPAADPSEGDAAPPLGSVDAPVDVTLAPAVEEPVAGGTLRFAIEADVDGLNPTASSLSAPGQLMGQAVFDTLAAFDVDRVAVPYLAQSFTPSDDLRTWTVALRPGITFHDGTPLDADAVVASFEAQRSSPLVGLAVRPLFPDDGAVTRIDDLTVQFNLAEPHRHFPTYVTGQLGMVASPSWLAAAAADPTLNQQPIGTGPFRFDSRTEDSVTRFVRNDAWWNGEVYLDAIEFYPVVDPDTATDLLFGGELEGLHTTNAGSIVRLDEDDDIQSILDDQGEESFIMMNTSVPPFDDLRARQALAWATPRAQYDQLIGLDVLRQATQRFTPESPYHEPSLDQVGDDAARWPRRSPPTTAPSAAPT